MRFVFGSERHRLKPDIEGELEADYGDQAIVLAAIRAKFQQDRMFVVKQLEDQTTSERLWRMAAEFERR